jgi:hypothetical protein
MRPERHNKVKVLLLLDIGGSMDEYIEESAQLFSAARAEFKHLETFYFHNCPYESLWRNNRRRHDQVPPTIEMMNTYGPDWKLIFVGDATMSPYEITEPGGSVEHWNAEPGAVWMARLLKRFRNTIWINPRDPRAWEGTSSARLMRQLIEGRMYPLTLDGLEAGLKELQRGR